MKSRNFERGQMLLIVVLTMIVALTVGLSVVSRTITGLRISKQNEESQRAFQAAEAGIERAIQSGASGNTSFNFPANNSKYSTSVLSNLTSGNNFLLNGGEAVTQDSGIDVWLANYPGYTSPYSGTLTLYWNPATKTSCTPGNGVNTAAAIEVNVISGTATPVTNTPSPTSPPAATATPTQTTVTIPVAYDGDVTSGGDANTSATTMRVEGSNAQRSYLRFDNLSSQIPANATITNVQLRYNVVTASGGSTALAPYNGNGQANPSSDNGEDRWSRSKPSATYVSNVSLLGDLGLKTLTLPAQARTDLQAARNVVNNRFSLAFNEGANFSLTSAQISTGEATSANRPALIVTYTTPAPTSTTAPTPTTAPPSSNLTLTKYVFDPCSGRTSGASATGGAGGAGGVNNFNNSAAITISSGLITKIIPLYGSTIVGVTSSTALPSQGKVIDSTGSSQEVVRKIRYFTSNPQIPLEIFPYSILSQ